MRRLRDRIAGLWLTASAMLLLGGALWFVIPTLAGFELVRIQRPAFFWLLLLSPILYAVAWRTLASVSHWQRIVMATARCLLVGVIVVVLAGPRLRVETRERCTVLLADVSHSISDEALEFAERWASEYERQSPAGDVTFRAAFDATARAITGPFRQARSRQTANASDYGRGIEFAASLCAAEQQRMLVVLGDGLSTRPGMAAAAQRLRQLGFSIHVVPARSAPPADVAVRRVAMPSGVEVGRPFRIGVDLHATRATDVTLEFELDGAPNPRDPGRELALPAGDTHLEFESVTAREGKAVVRVTARSKLTDAMAENDRATASIDVKGPPKVLYVEGRPERATAFDAAMTAQRFAVKVVSPAAFPTELDALRGIAFIVLSDLRREQLSSAADGLIERYVRELGGGLLFAGGSSSYAAGGWSGSALERILPVTLSGTETQQKADVALVLVIDRSGSMSGLPLEMAKAACAASVETLRPNDWIEVIAFDAKPVRYVAMQRARARVAIANDLSRMLSGGDTELFPALDMAYQDLLVVNARRKHVVLLTDGQSPQAGLSEIVQSMVGESITLTIVGLGSDVDTELLRHLAARGGGRYHAAPEPNSLPRIFTREAESIVAAPETSSWFEVRVRSAAEFLRGIPMDHLPALHGYARTQKRSGAAEVILESDRAEPVLARMRYGAGWTLAWTSDIREEWGSEWVRWPEYGRFFAQMVRQHQGRRVDATIPMQVELIGDQLLVSVDAMTATGSFDNDRSIRLDIEGPDAASTATIELELVAPGRYRAEYTLAKLGDYRLHATHRRVDERAAIRELGDSFAQISLPYPVEYQRLAPDLPALEQLSRLTEGTFEPTVEALRKLPRKAFVTYQPWHVPWLLAGLGLLLIDLAAKRIRFRRSADSVAEGRKIH